MKRLLSILTTTALAAASVVALSGQPAAAAVGLHISGTNIVEANGRTFVMRGVNHEHVWFTSQTSSFANLKALGSNTVRVVLGSGKRWGPSNDVANVISLCKANKMICVLEVHDTTGYGEDGAAASLDEAVNYWISQKSVLVGQEDYVVINIGNEPIGNNNAGQWTTASANAVAKMRSNGFQHLLMVDAPNWGQDWTNVMRDTGQTVLDADPLKNTVLSIHMYAVYPTQASIAAYLDAIAAKGWPLVIGEFGWQFQSGEVDDQAVMSEAVKRNLGYLGWSWSGNNDPRLDMVPVSTWDPTQLTTWGKRIFQGTNGITATAKQASIFDGGTTTTTTTSRPTTTTTTTTTTSRPTTTTTTTTSRPTTTTTTTSRPTTTTTTTSRPTTTTTTTSRPTTTTTTTSRPTTTTTTTSRPTTTTTASGGGGKNCSATYAVTGQWPSGFQGDVKVTAGSSAITGWTVTWTFGNGQTVSQSWSSTLTSSGATVTAGNAAWNGSLGAGASTNFGFLGSWNNSTNAVPTVSCIAS